MREWWLRTQPQHRACASIYQHGSKSPYLQLLRCTKVRELDIACRGHKDVCALDVAMHDAVGMKVRQTLKIGGRRSVRWCPPLRKMLTLEFADRFYFAEHPKRTSKIWRVDFRVED